MQESRPPFLEKCAKSLPLPKEINRGLIIEFKKPIKLFGFPVISGSAMRKNAFFGNKTLITVERGFVLEKNKNIIMFQTETKNGEIVFPMLHDNINLS